MCLPLLFTFTIPKYLRGMYVGRCLTLGFLNAPSQPKENTQPISLTSLAPLFNEVVERDASSELKAHLAAFIEMGILSAPKAMTTPYLSTFQTLI